MNALHQNVANCQSTLTVLTQRWRIFPQDIWMGQMCMTDAGTTQDNFILPAQPVKGGGGQAVRPLSVAVFYRKTTLK